MVAFATVNPAPVAIQSGSISLLRWIADLVFAGYRRLGPLDAATWLALGREFSAVRGKINGAWTRHKPHEAATWTLEARDGASGVDVKHFDAVARLAARHLARPRFRWGRALSDAELLDRWLNVAAIMADPERGFHGSGRSFGVPRIHAEANDVSRASVVVCAMLAAGDRPDHYFGPESST